MVLSLETSRLDAIITLVDSGIGISQNDLPHIFDRFHRSQGAKEMVPRGSGLGLSVAKSIVEGHSGSINVDSEFGHGTTITIRLPLLNKKQIKRQ